MRRRAQTILHRGFRLTFTVLALMGVIFSAELVQAATWYVATTGSDSNSCAAARNSSTPKRTIRAALACVGSAGTEAGAGHTVQVTSGVYNEVLVDVIPSGSSESNRFTLKSTTPLGAVIRPTASPIETGYIQSSGNSHYITVDGFVFDGSVNATPENHGIVFSTGFQGSIHHWRIINNEFKTIGCQGINASRSENIEVTNNSAHDSGATATCGGYFIYAATGSRNWLIERNNLYNWGGYGLHIYDPSGTSGNNVVRYNIIHNNGAKNNQSGIVDVGGSNDQFYRNEIYSNASQGINFGFSGANGNLFFNNTIYGNGDRGIISQSAASGNVIKNNIIRNNPGGSIATFGGTAPTSSNNICSHANTGCTVADPLFVDAANANFHLRAGSPAIGAGTCSIADGITLVGNGGRCDIGAYDYTDGSVGSPPTPPSNLILQP